MLRIILTGSLVACLCHGPPARAQGSTPAPNASLPLQWVDFDRLVQREPPPPAPPPTLRPPTPAVPPAPAVSSPLPGTTSAPLTGEVSAVPPETWGGPQGQPLAAGVSGVDQPLAEPLPLQQQTEQWYSRPWLWISTGWNNHVELGLNASEGNSQTVSLTTGASLKRTGEQYELGIDANYVRTTSRGALTQNSGRFNADYDRLLGDSRWSAFDKVGLEWDQFKAFDLRVNLNAGLGYYWIRSEPTNLVTRFGAGASREIGAPDDRWVPEALFGIEASHQLTSRQKLRGKLDYFPEWGDFANYRVVSDVAWEILLDESENLSLKIAATDRYDSTPQGGAKPNDLFYSMLLLYKF